MSNPSIIYDVFKSPLGNLYLIFTGTALTGIAFDKPFGASYKKSSAPKAFLKELASYFQGKKDSFNQEMKFLTGTEFEKSVWMALPEIPIGETRSYKWVAEHIGKPAAVRAVGQALSKNPLPIVIPCHRVIESDGSIGGYAGGVNTKVRLLEMEYYAKMNK
jgi:methylated-DNA-[protein]-cysteine S-methyltransferase